jgi:high-affinity nickel permease
MTGYLIISIFVVSWLAAAVIYRMRGYARVKSATTTRIRDR